MKPANRLLVKMAWVIILLITIPSRAFCTQNLGTFGKTYPIIEKDALTEIEKRANAVDWQKIREHAKESVKSYKPEGLPRLPRANKNETYQVDMTYTLEFDILDEKGKILYPKGYTLNPLDYVITSAATWVVIDASDKLQLKWYKQSKYYDDITSKLLISDGSYHELSQKLKRPVFYALPNIVEKLQLRVTPSIIYQNKNKMEVKTVDVTSFILK